MDRIDEVNGEIEKTWAEYELEFAQGNARFWRFLAIYSFLMMAVLLIMLALLMFEVNPWFVVIAGGLAL